MKLFTKLPTLGLLFLLSGAVMADSPTLSYDYFSIGINKGKHPITYTDATLDSDENDVNIDTFFINGSTSIADNFYLNIGLYSGQSDEENFIVAAGSRQTDIDHYRIQLGGGANIEMSEEHHGIFQINFEQEAYSISNDAIDINTDTENGFSIKAGVRSLFVDFFETGFYIEHIDTDETSTGVIAEARFRTANIGSIGIAAIMHETTTVSLDFRASF